MKKITPLLLLLLPAALYFGAIWQRPLFSPDEIRYAEVPREMLATGDFVTPRLAGLLYFEKPAPGYWLTAGSMKLFGETPFAVRFPAAAATLLTALLVYLWGRRTDGRELGVTAALIYLTTGLVFAVGTFAVLDAPFVFFTTLTLVAAFYADTESDWRKRAFYLVLAGIGAGGGFLIKGFLAAILPAVAGAAYLIWEKRWKRLFTLPWIPLATAAAIALPWVLAIHRVEPDFWRQFIWVEHFQRALEGAGANDDRAQPFWFYLPVLLGGALPWLLGLPEAIKGFAVDWKTRFKTPGFRLALAAGVVWLVLFSLSKAKLATYILPLFPGLAILFAGGLLFYGENGDFRWINRTLRVVSRLLIGILIGLVVCHLAIRFKLVPSPAWFPLESGESPLVPAAAFAIAAIWFGMASNEERAKVKFLAVVIGIAFLMLPVHGFMPRKLVRKYAPEPFLHTAVLPQLTPDTLIAAEKAMIPAAAWSFRHTGFKVGAIYERPGELAYGARRADFPYLSADDVARRTDTRQLVLLTQSKRLANSAPDPKVVLTAGNNRAVLYPGTGKKPAADNLKRPAGKEVIK